MKIRTDEEIIAAHDVKVRRRARTELEIVHKVIQTLMAAGYQCGVNTGEDTIEGCEQGLVDAVFSVDESYLIGYKNSRKHWVFFVLGNEGVISDYTTNLEMDLAPVNDWINKKVELGEF